MEMNPSIQQHLTTGSESWAAPFGRKLLKNGLRVSNSVARYSRSAIATILVSSLLAVSCADGMAQSMPPPPPQDRPAPMPVEKLDQLVAPIALYPDALVAQILAASTAGPQVVEADAFVRQHPGMAPQDLARLVDRQPWEPSVKALTAFPSVLSNLTTNFSWTTSLGEVYYNEPQAVMAEIQTMRQRAYAAGSLRTSSQETVVYQPGYITIMPATPAVVYVPVYNPWVVYGAPVPVYAAYVAPPPPAYSVGAAVAVGFTAGVLVGAFASYGWGCSHWETNWYSHTVVYNHVAYVSHGYYGGYGYRGGAYSYHGYGGYGGGYGYHGGGYGGGGYRGGYGYGGGTYHSGSGYYGSGYHGGTGSGYSGSGYHGSTGTGYGYNGGGYRGGSGYNGGYNGGGTNSGATYNGGHTGSGTGTGTTSASRVGSPTATSNFRQTSGTGSAPRSMASRATSGSGESGLRHFGGHFRAR